MKRSGFKPKPTWKYLAPISNRRKENYKIFVGLMEDYMKSHPHCERCLKKGLLIKSEELHHKRGRGIYYLAVEYFAALCLRCHSLCKREYKMMESEGWVLDRIGKL